MDENKHIPGQDAGDEGSPTMTGENEFEKLKPETIPAPTYWPAMFALGITLLAWGVVTSYLLSILGLGICVVAVVNWIGDIRHEQGIERSRQ